MSRLFFNLKNRKTSVILLLICVSAFLRFYRLADLMPFIGDQAWVFMSARDMMESGRIPLVGLTASRTWLHQGAFLTYIFGPILAIGGYNPLVPGLLTALVGVFTTMLVYIVAEKMYSERIAIIAGLLYASSPLVVLNDRMPFYTSFVPLISIVLFYVLFRLANGKAAVLPAVVFLLAVLHNMNLAGSIVWVFAGLLVIWGFATGPKWFREILNLKLGVTAFLAGLLPMVPFLLYDIQHGFPQTIKFAGWMIFRIFQIGSGSSGGIVWYDMGAYVGQMMQRLIFLPSMVAACIVMAAAIVYVIYLSLHDAVRGRLSDPKVFLIAYILICLIGIVANSTPSEAYGPVMYPQLIVVLAICVERVFRRTLAYILVGCCFFLNSSLLINQDFFVNRSPGYGASLSKQVEVSKSILKNVQNEDFSIVAIGPGSDFISTSMNIEYILWWLGREPVVDGGVNVLIEQGTGDIFVRYERKN